MDEITVVCHKDHDKGYEDYVGKCLLCEVERLSKREWVGLEDEDVYTVKNEFNRGALWAEAELKGKNT